MMRRWLRSLLPLLLAFALPLQGIAATTMRFCLPMHPAVPASVVAEHAAHGHGNPTRDGAHRGAGSGGPVGDDAHSGDDVAASPMAKAANGTCSVCAACSAAALPATPLPLPAAAPDDRLALPCTKPHIGVTPGGLERPPRFNLA